jgi:branched-chain amino acid transport system substrate-binding protein
LSLHDLIAMPAMIDRARSINRPRFGLMLANTAWGRDNKEAAERHIAKLSNVRIVGIEFHNARDTTLLTQYKRLLDQGAQAILLVMSDVEAALLVREVAALDAKMRLPMISHWGLTGVAFFETTGSEILNSVDLSIIQTFSLARADPKKLQRITAVARKLGGALMPQDIRSPTGFAHAYDLTHILARAINIAGSTDRSMVRDALEQVKNYDGLVRYFESPFTEDRHEALRASDLFFVRYRSDGVLVPADSGRGGAASKTAPR